MSTISSGDFPPEIHITDTLTKSRHYRGCLNTKSGLEPGLELRLELVLGKALHNHWGPEPGWTFRDILFKSNDDQD